MANAVQSSRGSVTIQHFSVKYQIRCELTYRQPHCLPYPDFPKSWYMGVEVSVFTSQPPRIYRFSQEVLLPAIALELYKNKKRIEFKEQVTSLEKRVMQLFTKNLIAFGKHYHMIRPQAFMAAVYRNALMGPDFQLFREPPFVTDSLVEYQGPTDRARAQQLIPVGRQSEVPPTYCQEISRR